MCIIFIKLSISAQKFLISNISYTNFQKISTLILSDEKISQKINYQILKQIIYRSKKDKKQISIQEIYNKINNKNFNELKTILSQTDPIDIAEIICNLEDNVALKILKLIPKSKIGTTFINLKPEFQKLFIKKLSNTELSSVINKLFADDTAHLIQEMPSDIVDKILNATDDETRERINKVLGFPPDSAGSIMTPEFITLRPWMSVDDALKKIRSQAPSKETIYTCYVTDDEKKLIAIISAKDLIIHNPDEKISNFMKTNFIYAHTLTDKKDVSNMLSKYNLLALPIVDLENKIVGIVTIDDAIDVLQNEATEDFSKIAGIKPNNKPYLQTSIFKILFSRLPWLMLLMISATFTGLIINIYEETLNSLSPLLFACIPMLMGSGGNAGSQASVTVIRSLSLNEISFKDIFKVIWKEIKVAVLLAGILAVACFGKLLLIDNLLLGYNYTILISLVVSLALFATICFAKIVGACLPLFAKICKLDPAVVASPFIATIVDAVSLIIFCKFSIMIL